MQKLTQLIARLEKIAKQNGDSFKYQIDVTPARGLKPMRFEFLATEKTDGHYFTSGSGNTIEEAVEQADAEIVNALGEWGYEEKSA